MVSHLFLVLLLCFTNFAFGSNSKTPFELGLKAILSPSATIVHSTSGAPRWSEFNAPVPGTVVNVATEKDVQVTVQYLTKHNITFLAQNGGHGWINSLDLYQNGVLINLAALDFVTFNSEKTKATIGGGAIVGDVIAAAYANDAQVVTGNCNCVGTLGAALGGGYGNLMGIHGFSVDNILSMKVALPSGKFVTITAADEDLFWALRGAGPNFGIVTSAVMKAFPVPQAESIAWFGGLFYTGDKVEALAQAIEDLTLTPNMSIFQYYTTSGAPDFTPTILITPYYHGSEAEARAAFSSILAIGPYLDTTSILPYPEWNLGSEGFCTKGGRKPSYGAGFDLLVPSDWRKIWNDYTSFAKLPNAGNSVVLLEVYSLEVARSIKAPPASFPNRDIRYNAVVIPWYNSSSMDTIAQTFGSGVRDIWRSSGGLTTNRTYVNFAYGDESNEVVYHDSTPRLQRLKAKYDPHNIFSHWFNIRSD
ncbi:hypothetical protein HYALB_00008363 [Hymenoscyphus albidus]|uniref:FAD-binding PCMH-type domain-containing protein n=1 Tax=Hymenoscyphus albidus TaxID=595503 RepID=A0A9N9LS58_9HELO|nr:hypothetical protein HYALB_00008363 [Hymenoscyphus albidus]